MHLLPRFPKGGGIIPKRGTGRQRGFAVNTDYLHEFTELAKRLSFTETARFLNMSQSTLSKHVSHF